MKRAQTSTYRAALCGLGRMGQIRAKILSQSDYFHVAYVVEPVNTNARDSMARTFSAQSANFLSEVIKDVDCVILCTPTKFHRDDLKLALEHKKPVFTEKPLALTKKDTYQLYSMARNLKVPIFTAYNRRAAEPFRNLKSQCKPEDIQRISFTFRDNPMLPPDFLLTLGDIYEDLSCHDLDLTLWYLGIKPISVYAKGTATFNNLGVIDSAAAILGFPGGRVLICDWTRKSTTNYDERVEVFLKDKTLFASMHQKDGTNAYSFTESYWDSYVAEIEQFKTIVSDYYEKGTFTIERDYDYCLWIIEIVAALQRSAISGKEEFIFPTTPINLGLIGSLASTTAVDKLLQEEMWDFFHLKLSSNNYTGTNSIEGYFVESLSVPSAMELLNDGKHAIFEPTIFSSLQDYFSAVRITKEKNNKLALNFSLRFDPSFKKSQSAIRSATFPVEAKIHSSVGSSDLKTFLSQSNSLIHEIDLAVYTAWPFVNAEFLSHSETPNSLTLNFSFLKSDGTTVKTEITFTPDNSEKSISVNGSPFNQDPASNNLGVFSSFYQLVKFSTRDEEGISVDTNNLSLFWTYSLFEAVRNKH